MIDTLSLPGARHVRQFIRDENGAVTIDFVVITAGLVVAIIGMFSVLTNAVFEDAAAGIRDDILLATNR